MATGPFQLLLDGVPVSTLSSSGGTVTVTTSRAHGLVAGATIGLEDTTVAALNTTVGSALYSVATVASGTTFTFVSGTATFGGTAQGSAVFFVDVLNPVVNYATAARGAAFYALPGEVSFERSADASSSSLSFTVYQDVTPAGTASANTGPWYATMPDNTRVRFVDTTAPTPSVPLFLGLVTGFDVALREGNLGTTTQVSVSDANYVLDRLIVRKAATSATVRGQVANSVSYTSASAKKEYEIVRSVLGLVNTQKLSDKALQRIFNTNNTSQIATSLTSTVSSANEKLEITLGSLRNALDACVELFSGQDGYLRRYWIDAQGRLHYERVDTPPTYSTAPFKITTALGEDPDNTSGASTLTPRSLEVSYDAQSVTKRAYFLTADSTTDTDTDSDPFFRTYTGVGYASRPGPSLEDVVEAATVRGKTRTTKLTTFAKAYFLERSKPILTGTFVVRGAGSQAHNRYGFATGYAQTGAATYALTSWEPGQWVTVTAPAYGIAAEQFRVETVSWSFEPDSLQRVVTVTFARRRRGSLARLIAGLL